MIISKYFSLLWIVNHLIIEKSDTNINIILTYFLYSIVWLVVKAEDTSIQTSLPPTILTPSFTEFTVFGGKIFEIILYSTSILFNILQHFDLMQATLKIECN